VICRKAERDDLAELVALEHSVFTTDRFSRRSLQRLLPATLVAEHEGQLIGSAIVLFRRRSTIARLYSLAVAPCAHGNERCDLATCTAASGQTYGVVYQMLSNVQHLVHYGSSLCRTHAGLKMLRPAPKVLMFNP
jgi:hypothetical protein